MMNTQADDDGRRYTLVLHERSHCLTLDQALVVVRARRDGTETVRIRSVDLAEPFLVQMAHVQSIVSHGDDRELVDAMLESTR